MIKGKPDKHGFVWERIYRGTKTYTHWSYENCEHINHDHRKAGEIRESKNQPYPNFLFHNRKNIEKGGPYE